MADGRIGLLAPWIGGAANNSAAPPTQYGFRSLFAPWLGGAGVYGSAVVTTSSSGVGRKKSIRLREVEKREDLGEFIKAQLNLKHADLLPQEQKKPRQTKAQKAEQQKIELAMKSMAMELEQERLVQANNDLLTLMLLAEV